jgi:hypothetical protein
MDSQTVTLLGRRELDQSRMSHDIYASAAVQCVHCVAHQCPAAAPILGGAEYQQPASICDAMGSAARTVFASAKGDFQALDHASRPPPIFRDMGFEHKNGHRERANSPAFIGVYDLS